jgi:GntR family transcriptional repressor for pyruvate dehydrogenase complex
MPNSHQRGRVAELIRKLEDTLLDGSVAANAQLGSERELAHQHGVSRNTVREAIQQLEARGLIQIRPRSGIFVSDRLRTGGAMASPWAQLMSGSPARREEMLEFRRVLEGATAYFAALRCSDGDRERIMDAMTRLEHARAVGDVASESRIDVELHEAIAAASGNSMFLHLHHSVTRMLREHIILNVDALREIDRSLSDLLLLQHRTICEAICERRPEEARTAMQAHIDYLRSKLSADAEHA